jgi:hypothetical protein
MCVFNTLAADRSSRLLTHFIFSQANPSYKFEYGVHDSHTKDIKQQSEHRDGHHTDSEYKVLEADGKNTRHVKITVDSQPIHGHHG